MTAQFTVADVSAALGREPERHADPEKVFAKVSIDSRRITEGDLFVALRGERHDGNAFLAAAAKAGAAGAIGEDRPFPGRDQLAYWIADDGRAALQSLASFHRRRLPTKVVGITGSNGKTTTKELVAAVLSQAYPTAATHGNLNNQIGVPLTILEIEPEHIWAVVEMGMNQPGEIAPLAAISDPQIGVITNVAASHLEGLGSVEAVLYEKLALGRALGPDDLLIYCGDQELLTSAAKKLPCQTLSYGLEPGNDLTPEEWSLDDEGRGSFTLEGRNLRLRLTGEHNIVNALAAVAVGRAAGLSIGRIAGGIAEPGSLPLRMQLEHWGEIIALVDCYNANPESVLSAASTLSTLGGVRRKVAVLGEMLELGEQSQALHHEVGRQLAAAPVDLVVTVGAGASPIADGAALEGVSSRRFEVKDDAITWLIESLDPGDAVLFKASRGAELEVVVSAVREACLDGRACHSKVRH